jgi:hypothetical protein
MDFYLNSYKQGKRPVYHDDSIFCCGCCCHVQPVLVLGDEVYPHRQDLAELPFWRCLGCGNFVGCHHKTKNPTAPLGCIPTPEIKNARRHIHSILDPLWKSGRYKRKELYERLAKATGRKNYHTAYIRSVEEARLVYAEIQKIHKEQSNDQ